MISDHAKELFAQIGFDYLPVAVKFSFNVPAGIDRCERQMPLCRYLKDVQETGRTYYVDLSDEACMGKCVLGFADYPPHAASGLKGFEHGYFRTPACNARIYLEVPRLAPGACNYVTFAPLADCSFSPDLVIFVAETSQAELVMRACSYANGDPYESKSTIAMSCGWLYAYPYVTGKVNFCITGMHSGMRKMKLYPAGLHIISVPYQKLDDLIIGLDEMEWDLIGFSDDPAVQAIAKAGDAKVAEMADPHKTFALDERLR